MYARIALSVVLAAAFCAPSSASRKFTGNQSLVYESEDPIVEGLDEFGLSLWILVRDDGGEAPSTQGIIDNLRTPDGNGFALYYERVDKVRSVVFRYQGDLSRAKSGLIETRANLGMAQIGKWIHVAADLSLTTAMKTKARIWINGRSGKVESGPPFKAMTGSPMLFIGGRPRPGGSGGDTGFRGDVHDICIVDHRWTRKQLNHLSRQKQSARDVAPFSTIRFNPRLRDNAGKDDISGIVPDVFGGPVKGMGPPITYGDQKPTVLIIGDTQNLDWGQQEVDEMLRLGQFVVDYKDTLRIAAVFHVGDWIACGWPHQRLRARALADKLVEAGIPWACTIGNHDYDDVCGNPELRDLEDWSNPVNPDAMPEWLFRKSPHGPDHEWYVGRMGTTKHADGDYAHAFTFDLDGVPQLGISLPYKLTANDDSTDYTLGWAVDVAAPFWDPQDPGDYRGLRVWLVTHYFLEGSGVFGTNVPAYLTDDPTDDYAVCAKDAFDDYLSRIGDLAFILCGHLSVRAVHNDDPDHQTCTGRRVYGLLVNDQGPEEGDGGAGFMQILTAEVNNDELAKVFVETYAALTDEFIGPHIGNFTFELDLTE